MGDHACRGLEWILPAELLFHAVVYFLSVRVLRLQSSAVARSPCSKSWDSDAILSPFTSLWSLLCLERAAK